MNNFSKDNTRIPRGVRFFLAQQTRYNTTKKKASFGCKQGFFALQTRLLYNANKASLQRKVVCQNRIYREL